MIANVLDNDFNADLARALGRQLRVARKSMGLTLAEVAERMHSHRPIVGRTEAGRFLPGLEKLVAHAIVVGLPLRVVGITIDDAIEAHRRGAAATASEVPAEPRRGASRSGARRAP